METCCFCSCSVILLITYAVSILTIIGVGCFMLCRYQSHKHQLASEKARNDFAKEEARIKRIHEYRAKMLEYIKSEKIKEAGNNLYISSIKKWIGEDPQSATESKSHQENI